MGRNLIVTDEIVIGKWITNTGAESASVVCMSSGYIPVEAGETISLSYWQPAGNHTGTNRAWTGTPIYYDSSKSYLSGYESRYFNDEYLTITETVPANAKYVRATFELPRNMEGDIVASQWTIDSDFKWQIEKSYPTGWKMPGGGAEMIGYGHISITSLVDASPSLGMKVNYENFTTANNGEAYLHGYTNEVAADVNGYVMWNGVKRTVPKAMINPNTGVPYNKTIYIVLRLSSATATTGTLYNVWYNSGWKYGSISAPSAAAWTWINDRDIVLGQYVEPSSEGALMDAYLYYPPRSSTEVWNSESAYEKAAAAQTTANTANSTANTAKTNAATAQTTANTALDTANIAKSATEMIVGTQTAATGTWTGVASFAALTDGQSIVYWLPFAGSGNATLNLTLSGGGTTGAIPCYYGSTTRLTTHYGAGSAIRLLYRENVTIGSTTIAKGWWADANYNADTYDRVRNTASITAASAITAVQIIVANSAGNYVPLSTTAFDITKPILYAHSAIAANATGTNNYLVFPNINLTTTKSGFSGTANATAYIVGTLSGSLFTPNSTILTTAVPTSDNGLYYIALGRMRSTTNMDLYPEHPIYKYYNGKFESTQQMAYEAFVQANTATDKIDNLEIGGRNLLLSTGTPDTHSSITLNSSNYAVHDYYITCSPVPNLFDVDDLITVSFDWSTTSTGGNFHVECGTVTPYVWGTIVSASGGRASNSNYIDVTSSNQSGRFVITFKITTSQKNAAATLQKFRLRVDGTDWSGKSLTVSNAKLERGNRATDWSPAPEDTEAAVNAIRIGGTNLYRDSNAPSLAKVSAPDARYYSGSASADSSFTGTIIAITDPPVTGIAYGSKEVYDGTQTVVTNHSLSTGTNNVKLVEGNAYVVSAWAKVVSGSGKVCFQVGSSPYVCILSVDVDATTTGTAWKHYEASFTYTTAAHGGGGTGARIYIGAISKANTAFELHTCGFMVEEGTRSSSWKPAPGDVDASIALVKETAEKAKYQTEVIVGTQTTTTASWTGVASFPTLVDGQTILYWLPQTAAANVTLNLTLSGGGTTGAIPCYYGGTSRLGTHYAAGNAVRLLYRENVTIGSTTIAKGWWSDANYNTNNYDRIQHTSAITAGAAIVAGHMVAANAAGTYSHIAASTAFDITKPILYAGSAIAANATGTNNYLVIPNLNLATSKSGFTGTSQYTVYIVGTLNGNLFTPNSTIYTTTAPTSDDGLYYIALGRMRSTTNMDLYPEHPIYKFYNDKFQTTQQMAYDAFVQAKSAQSDIDNLEVGGRNLFLESYDSTKWRINNPSGYLTAALNLSENLIKGEEYTITIWGENPTRSDKTDTWYSLYWGGGNVRLVEKIKIGSDGKGSATFNSGTSTHANTENAFLYIFNTPTAGASGTTYGSSITKLKIEKGNRATDYSPAPEDFENHIVQETTKAYTNAVSNAEGFFNSAIREYVRTSDLNTFKQTVSTQFNQTADSISIQFTNAVNLINSLQNDTSGQFTEIKKYIRFINGAIVLGEEGNALILRLVNNRISFESNGSEVAYFSDNRMSVENVTIGTSLNLLGLMVTKDTSGNIFIG